MSRNPKSYDDDDGRTIADMSGIEQPGMFIPHSFPQETSPDDSCESEERPWESSPMPKGERFAWVTGALMAALLIGLVFLLGIGAVILLLTKVWG